jgi:hypothetical protein
VTTGMESLRFTLALGAVLFLGCATAGRSSPPRLKSSLPVVTSQAFTAVIDPRLVNFPDSWTPTEEEVLLAEPKVQSCVLAQRPGLQSSLRLYVRHYSGWTVEGRRTLRVQFFDSRSFRADQLSEMSEVVDGDGQTYFVMSFDIDSGKCSF